MPTRNPNSSFEVNLQPDERVQLTARRHWAVLARDEIIWVTLWTLCSIIFLWRISTDGLDPLNIGLFVIGTFFFLGIVYVFFDWHEDALVVTSQRVVFIDSHFLISIQRNELYNRDIQDVKMTTESVLARYFNYGQIDVQTASRLRNIRFHGVARPALVRDAILRNVDPLKKDFQTERVQQLVRAKVMKDGAPPSIPPPSTFISRDKTGRGYFGIVPPSPMIRGDSVIWRKHWLFLLLEVANPLIVIMIILISWTLLLKAGAITGAGPLVVLALLIVFCLIWLVYEIADWRDDEYIITPRNVIDIERRPLGRETKRETSWDRIEKVSLTQANIWARIFKYGDIELATAGQQENFTFRRVNSPDSVLAIISDYRDQFLRRAKDSEFDSTLMLMHQYHVLQQQAQAAAATPPPTPPSQKLP
jgi:uncharacterized membrane protein YdbT with pleckstrin-like domain